jgi:4a-hydroxytetrahydrobiopterin dehydratase
MPPKKYTKKEIETAFKKLDGWELKNNSLMRNVMFNSFVHAINFMSFIVLEAEKLNHHPKCKRNHDKVSIVIKTHDVDGLTELDFKLATRINKLIENGF